MKKSDLILIVFLLVVAVGSFVYFQRLTSQNSVVDGTANVYYKDQIILTIELKDGTYQIHNDTLVVDASLGEYTVVGSNGDVVIEYKDHRVRVIDEISPKNICQIQGWSNSPYQPITCLPNNIVILIEADKGDDAPDDITG
ncbi:MAG: NusG domain II-containing protein [Candidatus Izemoplasma sp.]|nr:NusG domain II-containing protein [Candidatus Izemoplasma sp.]